MRVGVCAAAALAVVASALAAEEPPTSYGVVTRGSYKLVSTVRLTPKGGEMKGVWMDPRQGCRVSHKLNVMIQIDLVRPNGQTRQVQKWKTGPVANCSEGGPNFGFDLDPRELELGCSDGRWVPGRYSMTTRTRDPRANLAASASLYRQVTKRC
jgi:hypothetical protein